MGNYAKKKKVSGPEGLSQLVLRYGWPEKVLKEAVKIKWSFWN